MDDTDTTETFYKHFLIQASSVSDFKRTTNRNTNFFGITVKYFLQSSTSILSYILYRVAALVCQGWNWKSSLKFADCRIRTDGSTVIFGQVQGRSELSLIFSLWFPQNRQLLCRHPDGGGGGANFATSKDWELTLSRNYRWVIMSLS